jgi:hypothetical protein
VGIGDSQPPGTEPRPEAAEPRPEAAEPRPQAAERRPRRKSRPGEGRSAAAAPQHTTPGLSTGAKIFVGALIAVLYAVGMIMRGEIAPGIVGGILAGVLAFLVLREIELRRERRERGQRR